MPPKRGALPGFQPIKERYKCPVKNCDASNIRGDEISKHFQINANLLVLEKALENQALLKKNVQAGIVIDVSDEDLKSLLSHASENEKLHTIYLYQNGHSSLSLPKNSSVNFKCQQKKFTQAKSAFQNLFNPGPKKMKPSENIENVENIDNIGNQDASPDLSTNTEPETNTENLEIRETEMEVDMGIESQIGIMNSSQTQQTGENLLAKNEKKVSDNISELDANIEINEQTSSITKSTFFKIFCQRTIF